MRAAIGLTLVMLVFLTGCATTERVAVKDQPAVCGFLGESCEYLSQGSEGQAGLRWFNPRAQLTRYNKVIVDVVGFYGVDAAKVPPKDQEALTALFQKSLTDALAKRYQVVDQSGPGVMRLQVALLDADAATPGLRSLTMVIPQARLLSTGAYAISGKYPFVGGAQAAAKVTDSMTGQVLAAAADRRVGGGSVETAAQWQWGDAENAIKAWSQLAADGLYAYTFGAKKAQR
jgi:hypothetical protein